MRASLFEVWKLTQRTLEGAKVPDGHDREGAFAIQWLSERGFGGFDMFGDAAPEQAGSWRLSIGDDGSLDAGGSPVMSLGADIIDFCAAQAMNSPDGVAEVTVRGVRGPAFLLPFAARRCLNTGACRLRWTGGDGVGYEVTIAGVETVWIDGGPALCDTQDPVDVVIAFDAQGAALRAGDNAPVGHLLNPEKLKARRDACLSEGIEIADDLWDRMQSAAKVVLVPATEQSREQGAGGGDAND